MDIEYIQKIDTGKYIDMALNHKDFPIGWALSKCEEKRYSDEVNSINEDVKYSAKQKKAEKRKALECHEKAMNEIKQTNYRQPMTDEQREHVMEAIKWQSKWREKHLEALINRKALPKIDVLKEHLKHLLEHDFKNKEKANKIIIDVDIVPNFDLVARHIGLIEFTQYLANQIAEETQILFGENNTKGLTQPQKILLLDRLGFFKLDVIKSLNSRQRGRIVGAICGGNETNTEMWINGLNSKKGTRNPYYNKENENTVNELLRENNVKV